MRHLLMLADASELGWIVPISAEEMAKLVARGSRKALHGLVLDAEARMSTKGTRKQDRGKDDDPTPDHPALFVKIHHHLRRLASASNTNKKLRLLVRQARLDTVPGLEHTLCKLSKSRNKMGELALREWVWDGTVDGFSRDDFWLEA